MGHEEEVTMRDKIRVRVLSYYILSDPWQSNAAHSLDGMFQALPPVSTLDLKCCKLLTNQTLKIIASCLEDSLETLNLHLCKRVTDDGSYTIWTFAISLIKSGLVLTCTHQTGLRELSRLKRLTSLDIGFCKRITNSGLAHICKLKSLLSLNLTGCEFDEGEALTAPHQHKCRSNEVFPSKQLVFSSCAQ